MKNIFKYLFLLGIAGLFAVSCKTVPPDNSHVDPAKMLLRIPSRA